MGLFTWVILAALALVILGLGVGTFASGMFEGAKTVGENPVVQNATNQAKEIVKDGANKALS
jgi:hypothetical protein